jgi:hypothetical protein
MVALRCGMSTMISFFSVRGEFGTVIQQATNAETAVKALGHAAGTHTSLEHYDKGLDNLDTTDLAIDGATARSSETPLFSHPCSRV